MSRFMPFPVSIASELRDAIIRLATSGDANETAEKIRDEYERKADAGDWHSRSVRSLLLKEILRQITTKVFHEPECSIRISKKEPAFQMPMVLSFIEKTKDGERMRLHEHWAFLPLQTVRDKANEMDTQAWELQRRAHALRSLASIAEREGAVNIAGFLASIGQTIDLIDVSELEAA